jgi:hypothetical protein
MLSGMHKTPAKFPSEPPTPSDSTEGDESAAKTIPLPAHLAGSGALCRLVETARDCARQAASENTLTAYAKD